MGRGKLCCLELLLDGTKTEVPCGGRKKRPPTAEDWQSTARASEGAPVEKIGCAWPADPVADRAAFRVNGAVPARQTLLSASRRDFRRSSEADKGFGV